MRERTHIKHILMTGIFLSVLCASLYGCSAGIKKYVRPDTDVREIENIAVVPLENYTSDEFADEKMTSLLIIDLLSRGVEVIEPGEVSRAMGELRIRSKEMISVTDLQNLGKMLNVDAIMTGSVSAFGISKGISVSYPEASISLMMHDAKTGDIIWSAWHTAGGASFWTRHFGAEDKTLDETSSRVIREAVDTLF